MVAMYRLSEGGQPVSLERVARRTRVSRRYLEQLAIQLKKASLVRGVSGRGGGYLLTRDPDDINLGEIVEATIGPINVVDCVLEPGTCLLSDTCECRTLYCLLNDRIKGVLCQFTLADLASSEHQKALLEDEALSDATSPGSCPVHT
jgi:Rrf2 family transcriptional regulator, cysteine metabolism repressor